MNVVENKNDKQIRFNYLKGVISEIVEKDKFCGILITVGHENKRDVYLTIKKENFHKIINSFVVGDKVRVQFYVTSFKHPHIDRWNTTANALFIDKVESVD
jgi:putative ribosome biogenesis GTPase RsgA